MPARQRMIIAVLAALAAGAVLAGCSGGGDGDDSRRRDRVRDYLEAVNAAQEDGGPLLQHANRVYSRFASGDLKQPQAEVEIRRSKVALDVVRGRVEAVPVPPEARKLRQLVLAVYEAHDGMAEQTRLMAAHPPAQEKAVRRFRTLGRRLQSQLRRAAQDAPSQARALQRYASGVATVRQRLQRLRVPLVAVPTLNTQLRRLSESRKVALGLRKAVLDRDQERVLDLLDEFQAVNARTPSTEATKAARRAYRVYVNAIRDAERRAGAEVRRLNRALRD